MVRRWSGLGQSGGGRLRTRRLRLQAVRTIPAAPRGTHLAPANLGCTGSRPVAPPSVDAPRRNRSSGPSAGHHPDAAESVGYAGTRNAIRTVDKTSGAAVPGN